MDDSATIINTLLEIKQDLGSILATLDATTKSLEKHVQDDLKLTDRVETLEVSHNRFKWTASLIAGAFVGLCKAVEVIFNSNGGHH
jgi:hypothetical protein